MSLFDALRYRLRSLTQPGARDREIAEEMQHHLDLDAADARSLGERDSGLEARRRFGNATYSAEERRRISGTATIDALRQDARFVVRLLRRRAGFSVVTIATIALGIAAATSIFSVADAVLFRPLAFRNSDELTNVWLTRNHWKKIPGLVKRWDHGAISLPSFRQWRAGQTSFSDVAVWETASGFVGGETSPDEMLLGRASASLFTVLGIRAEVGAWFTEANDAATGAPVAVVSHETWAARFGSDPHILGALVDINGVRHTIIGVAPKGLSLDRGPATIAFWLPAFQDSANANNPGAYNYQAIGRIKHGVSPTSASIEAKRLLTIGTTDDQIDGALAIPLYADQTRIVRGPLLILLIASGLLLLIACINVATLLMGEAVGRERELRTRTALGASRARLLRQLLTESVFLAGVGGALGAALSVIATRIIVHAAPPTIPGLSDVRIDARVLTVTFFSVVITGILFGLVPAFALIRAGARNPFETNRASARGRERAQRTFIVCEVALSMVLLVSAGLLVRSFSKLSSVGFEPSRLFVATLRFPRAVYGDSIHVRSVFADVEQRLRSIPGVVAVGSTTTSPFSTGTSSTSIEIEGRSVSTSSPGPTVNRKATTPAFFATAAIPLVSGRFYSDADRADAPLVVVVNRALAEREWVGESAVGKRIKFAGQWRTVIGVA